jgi:predicted ATPase
MFDSLDIKSFKCLTKLRLDLSPLTLLTGFNAVGKSSVVQSLALIKQTAGEAEWNRSFKLNGGSVQLGTMFDVIDRNSGGDGFSITISAAGGTCEWETRSVERKSDLAATIHRIRVSVDDVTEEWTGANLAQLRLQRLVPDKVRERSAAFYDGIQELFASITHIGAERIGPREVYTATSPLTYPDVGTQGERTPWCLEQFADAPANPTLAREGVPETVRLTVKAWMNQLFPGFDMEIKKIDGANLVTVGVRTSPGGDFYRPGNVGFGLTHVLPIVTACVAARPGRVVIVENPETHLHPAGQSEVGYFLAMAAASGVQLIVETHSDHILNGVRRAVRDQKIASDAARVFFFKSAPQADGSTRSEVTQIDMGADGRVASWPPGFFDQIELDLDDLFRP